MPTGRWPAGWSVPFALAWPVDAIVAENGTGALFTGKKGLLRTTGGHELLSKIYQQDVAARLAHQARLQQVAYRVLHEVPGALLASHRQHT